MDYSPSSEFLISEDNGDSYYISFDSLLEANKYLDNYPRLKDSGSKVFEKIRYANFISIDSLIPIIEKIEREFMPSQESYTMEECVAIQIRSLMIDAKDLMMVKRTEDQDVKRFAALALVNLIKDLKERDKVK